VFQGAGGVPIHGIVAVPPKAKGTIVGTYGIVGDLDNQWFLRVLGRKAYAQGYAVVLFDWRAHGKTVELSPTLTSDGIYEGQDCVHIAAQSKALGCPARFGLLVTPCLILDKQHRACGLIAGIESLKSNV
jgi:predicted alpha/beta-fold hydrolase